MPCPICQFDGVLNPFVYQMPITLPDGRSLIVDLDAVHCSWCKQDSETPEITIANNLKIKRAVSLQGGDRA